MAKVYEFLATGFEDIEALHGVKIEADMLIEDADFGDADLLMLPGGLPGATNLNAHAGVRKALVEHNVRGKMIGAICAAPMVLGGLGMLEGKRATCYPGFEKYLEGAEYTNELCTVDGNITTGEGPAAALPYAYKLLAALTDAKTADGIADGMMYKHLMLK